MKAFALGLALWTLASTGCRAQPNDDSGLVLVANVDGRDVRLTVENRTGSSQQISREFAFAGTGGGNVLLIAINPLGQLVRPCAKVDLLAAWDAPRDLAAGATEEAWRGTTDRLVQWHCLDPGAYSVRFAYKTPSDAIVFSQPLTLRVDARSSSIEEAIRP